MHRECRFFLVVLIAACVIVAIPKLSYAGQDPRRVQDRLDWHKNGINHYQNLMSFDLYTPGETTWCGHKTRAGTEYDHGHLVSSFGEYWCSDGYYVTKSMVELFWDIKYPRTKWVKHGYQTWIQTRGAEIIVGEEYDLVNATNVDLEWINQIDHMRKVLAARLNHNDDVEITHCIEKNRDSPVYESTASFLVIGNNEEELYKKKP